MSVFLGPCIWDRIPTVYLGNFSAKKTVYTPFIYGSGQPCVCVCACVCVCVCVWCTHVHTVSNLSKLSVASLDMQLVAAADMQSNCADPVCECDVCVTCVCVSVCV